MDEMKNAGVTIVNNTSVKEVYTSTNQYNEERRDETERGRERGETERRERRERKHNGPLKSNIFL